jgi:plasmid stabilization system protein ParE
MRKYRLVHGVRMLAIKDFESYILFYLEHEDCVDVIRVLHGHAIYRKLCNLGNARAVSQGGDQ